MCQPKVVAGLSNSFRSRSTVFAHEIRATNSDSPFTLLQKEQEKGFALLFFEKRAALSNSLFVSRAM